MEHRSVYGFRPASDELSTYHVTGSSRVADNGAVYKLTQTGKLASPLEIQLILHFPEPAIYIPLHLLTFGCRQFALAGPTA